MRVSAKAEYACLAMGELAIRYPSNTPLSLKVIADVYEISHAFLMQIFLQLKGGRLVQSVRGPSGGYQLTRDPKFIRIAEIVELIDGPSASDSALSNLRPMPISQALQLIWREAGNAQRTVLDDITLADLLQRLPSSPTSDYQI